MKKMKNVPLPIGHNPPPPKNVVKPPAPPGPPAPWQTHKSEVLEHLLNEMRLLSNAIEDICSEMPDKPAKLIFCRYHAQKLVKLIEDKTL
jgi:hypothetical protein